MFPSPREAVVTRLRNLFASLPYDPAWDQVLIVGATPNKLSDHMVVVTPVGGPANQGEAYALVKIECWAPNLAQAERLAQQVCAFAYGQMMQNCAEGIAYATVNSLPVSVPEPTGAKVLMMTLGVTLRHLTP